MEIEWGQFFIVRFLWDHFHTISLNPTGSYQSSSYYIIIMFYFGLAQENPTLVEKIKMNGKLISSH